MRPESGQEPGAGGVMAASPERQRMNARRRYLLLCAVCGVALGMVPRFLHGPIPQKFNIHYIQGSIAVWAFYTARMLIGFLVGITVWPRRWFIRGPLCGILALFPLTLISLAMPRCGFP